MTTILNPPVTERNPLVIVCISKPGDPYDSEHQRHPGEFARVTVRTGEDWQFMKLLQHGEDYFAPANGDGLLVKADLLKR